MTSITTNTIKAIITNTTPTFKASIVQKGADGKEVEFQTTATHIQWRYVNGTWADLVALADLKGADGTNGIDGDDGNGIASITRTSGTGAAGTTDTYTITFDDLTTTTFDVYNGADGLGSGDMLKSVYDTNSNNIVDNAEKVNNHTVETDVPSGALFTDTVYTHPNHSGDVTSVADGAQTIANNVVDNAKLAQVAVNIIKGRKTAGTGNVEDLTVSDVLAMLDVYTQTEADNLLANKAPLSSPEFTDIPKAPTAPTGTDTTQLANTAFVQQELDVHKAENAIDAHATIPSCRIYHNANQSIANNALTVLAFNSERFDTDNMHNTVTNNSRITINTAGKYLLIAGVRYSANATGARSISLRVNDSISIAENNSFPNSNEPVYVNLSTIYDLNAGDYVQLLTYQNSGATIDVTYVDANNPKTTEFMAIKMG